MQNLEDDSTNHFLGLHVRTWCLIMDKKRMRWDTSLSTFGIRTQPVEDMKSFNFFSECNAKTWMIVWMSVFIWNQIPSFLSCHLRFWKVNRILYRDTWLFDWISENGRRICIFVSWRSPYCDWSDRQDSNMEDRRIWSFFRTRYQFPDQSCREYWFLVQDSDGFLFRFFEDLGHRELKILWIWR